MKKVIFTLLLVAALAQPAMAGTITTFSTLGTYASGNGGEFTLGIDGFALNGYVEGLTKNIPGFNTPTFQSFCLEVHEYIYTNATYQAVKNTNALMGGVADPGDPVSKGTGWLYSQFAQGSLQGYLGGGPFVTRKGAAKALQNTIWWLEEEGPNPGNYYSNLVTTHFGSEAAAKANGGDKYGVYALNLTNPKARDPYRQDVLYYDPVTVPDGGTTLMLLGSALMGLGALSRKFRR